jgi:hypothetical protein
MAVFRIEKKLIKILLIWGLKFVKLFLIFEIETYKKIPKILTFIQRQLCGKLKRYRTPLFSFYNPTKQTTKSNFGFSFFYICGYE